jgi:hypothetical protein
MKIFGVDVPDLEPELGTPIDVLVIAKLLKNDDDPSTGNCAYRLVTRSSGISAWEAAGMAQWVQHIAFDYDFDDDEEDDNDD